MNRLSASQRRLGAVIIGATVLLGALLVPSSANAYPNQGHSCNDSSLRWGFNSSSLWTTTKKNWVRATINTVDDALDYNGAKLVTVSESGGISVGLRDVPLTSQYGLAVCLIGSPYMWINSNATTAKFYYKVARHEMMHMAGAGHSGNQDSMNSDNPSTMSTCINQSTFRTVNSLDQDASAQLNWLHSRLANRQLHANIGFERGTRFWGASNGTISSVSSGGATGPGYAAFRASGSTSNSYIFQTIRLWTGSDTSKDFRAVLNARTPSSSVSSAARAAIYHRSLFYGSGSNSCDYRPGVTNPNNPTVGGTYVLLRQSSLTNLGTSWTSVASPWYESRVRAAGHQLQVRAYGSAGTSNSVRFDNVRGEER